MKVCIITTVDSPFDPRVFYKEAKSLAKVHDVVVIAPYAEPIKEDCDGIGVVTVKKPAKRIFHPITMWRILKEGFSRECDVYHCHAPDALFLGALLKILKRSKVVYDAREHYPSLIAENSLFPKFIKPFVRFLADIGERGLINFADVIITVDEILAAKYRQFHNYVVVMPNYPRLSFFKEDNYSEELNQKFKYNKVLLYVGGLTEYRGVLQSLQAFKKVLKVLPEAKLLFLGNFSGNTGYKENVFSYIRENDLNESVSFLGYVQHKNIPNYINLCDVGIVFLQPIPRYENAVPMKLFEYMSCGKPVIASDFSEIKNIVKEIDCGILVDPTVPDEIATAMIYLLSHQEEGKRMGLKGKFAVGEKYNWEVIEERIFKVYDDILDEHDVIGD
ncbi:MAG TPA: glycosyltransferase family 4 protein [Methanothrix sp.]|nr:glycosyltransferase family 4 protein [Methanothrix sp.]